MSTEKTAATRSIILAAPEQLINSCSKVLLDMEPSFWIVAETQDQDAIVEAVRRSQANILLIDLSMLKQPHFDLLSNVLKVSPSTRILILAEDGASPGVLDALASGARGIVQYRDIEKWLLKALLKVDAGEAWVSRKMAFHIVHRIRHLSICDHFSQRAGT